MERCPYVGGLHAAVSLLDSRWSWGWSVDEVKLLLNLRVRHLVLQLQLTTRCGLYEVAGRVIFRTEVQRDKVDGGHHYHKEF